MFSFVSEQGYTLVTKKRCDFSNKARTLLKKKNIKFVEIQVMQNDLSKNTWGYKKIKTVFKHNTFPILLDKSGKLIGGFDEILKKI